jgi:hypothetical protein
MTSIKYDKVFSRFYSKVEAFDFLYEELPEEMIAEYMAEWLLSAVTYPYIRRLFGTIILDNDEEEIQYTLRYNIDEFSDREFVTEVLAYAMVYSWLEPKVKSITSIYQNFTTSEQKFYSQSNHLSELRALLSDSESRIRALIRDRGYLNNPWLDGAN